MIREAHCSQNEPIHNYSRENAGKEKSNDWAHHQPIDDIVAAKHQGRMDSKHAHFKREKSHPSPERPCPNHPFFLMKERDGTLVILTVYDISKAIMSGEQASATKTAVPAPATKKHQVDP